MRLPRCLLLLASALLVTTLGHAGPPAETEPLAATARFGFVGFSIDKVAGDAGFFGMAVACQATFGPGARLATTAEVMRSPTISDAAVTEAWAQPIIEQAFRTYTNLDEAILYDVSGWSTPGHFDTINCRGWSTSSGSKNGLTVSGAALSVDWDPCSSLLWVACSGPK